MEHVEAQLMGYGNSIQTSREANRITCNVRIPAVEYHGEFANLKRYLQTAIGAEKPLSNTMALRLALWAMARVKDQAVHAGPEAERQLGYDLAREVRAMAAGKGIQG